MLLHLTCVTEDKSPDMVSHTDAVVRNADLIHTYKLTITYCVKIPMGTICLVELTVAQLSLTFCVPP